MPKRTVSISGRFKSAGQVSLAVLRTLAILVALALGTAAAGWTSGNNPSASHAGPSSTLAPPDTASAPSDPTTPALGSRPLNVNRLAGTVADGLKAPCRDDGFTEPCDEEESDESDSNDEGLHGGITIAEAESSAPHAFHHVRPSSSTTSTGRSPRAPPVPSSLV